MQYAENQLLDGRYVLKQFIGSGSFGEVWLANDQETDLEVAIKIYISMDTQGLSDFKKEFQLSFNLNHTNLLHANYLGVNASDNRPYLVMPFCPEGSVSKFAGRMSEQDLWHFIRDVAAGLDYLHSQKPPIIHQDIKPDNILILKNGDYVITDFGISKQLKSTLRKSAMHLNSAGAIAYMGPERFSKQYQAVKASDIWSFGVTIYELIVGDLPFCGMGGSLQKQGADIPELPENFSNEMNDIFMRCVAKETWDRPTARQVYEIAEKICRGGVELTYGGNKKTVEPEPEPEPQPKPETPSQPEDPNKTIIGPKPTDGGEVGPTSTPSPNKSNAWVYVGASVAGLIVGIILKVLQEWL